MYILKRRGFDLGSVPKPKPETNPTSMHVKQAWQIDEAIVLPALILEEVKNHEKNINNALLLMENVLNAQEITSFFEKTPYIERIQDNFFIAATSPEEHDEQGIEKIYFDAFNKGDEDNTQAEDLWCKGSWLSFHDDDTSLRFRFSWGMEGYEDVSADPVKQAWAGKLCDVLFPESEIVTQNDVILSHLSSILDKKPSFVERIVYFNAENGGAQFHHDVERGHAGVVFAQLSGRTFWLTAAKPKLIDEIIHFTQDPEHQSDIEAVLPKAKDREALSKLCSNSEDLNCYMEEPDHELIEAIIDRCPGFIAQLVAHGYSHVLKSGDVLLLPQRDDDNCVWHSVITLGEETGEALSFAVR